MIRSALVLALVAPAFTAQITFEASLSGAFETPPNASAASGRAVASYDPATGLFDCTVEVTGLTPSAIHVHDGDAGVAGPVLVGFTGGPTTWTITGATLSPAQLGDLLHEGLYVNAHTPAFPGGEIRGQLRAPRHLQSILIGANETPPVATAATGFARLELDGPTGTLAYQLDVNGMTATAAHIHAGATGVAGGIVQPLAGGPTSWSGTTPALSDGELLDLLAGDLYLNVHSATFPGGEIRGQVEVGGLNVDTDALSTTNGGVQTFSLRADAGHAGEIHLLLGSTSGSTPGFSFGGFAVPLNPLDPWFNTTLNAPNVAPLGNSLGVLDGSGDATATITLPPGSTAFAGITLTHAYATFTLAPITVRYVSNAVTLDLLP